MFDFHMHSVISFDGKDLPDAMLRAAEERGLKEICFTDHLDYDPLATEQTMVFSTEDYNAAYDALDSTVLKLRRGMEFGMTPDNAEQFKQDLKRRPFDFVLGSVHFAENLDVYFKPYWQGKTVLQGERRYLEETLACVKAHDGFDVLGHLTYIAKAWENPVHRPVAYDDHRELLDEILKELVRKGKGLEINTSGIDRCGAFLPHKEYLCRFKELGGEIVTVGSDAHGSDRVGQYCGEACRLLKELFGYVCTFEERKPIFHKL